MKKGNYEHFLCVCAKWFKCGQKPNKGPVQRLRRKVRKAFLLRQPSRKEGTGELIFIKNI